MWTLLGRDSVPIVTQFYDVEIVVEGFENQTPARASRSILGQKSPVLASFFSHRVKEGLPLSLVRFERAISCHGLLIFTIPSHCSSSSVFWKYLSRQKLTLPSGVSAPSLDAFISFCYNGKVILRSAGSVAELAVLADMLLYWVYISYSRAL
jgi:hypothetical protein